MAQSRSKRTQRQSDLQPVYDLIDALNPSKLQRSFLSLSHRTRWMLVSVVAGLIFLWVVISLMQLGVQTIRANSGPFLMDALRVPYNMEARLITPPGTLVNLPVQVGEYALQADSIQLTPAPVVDPAVVPTAPSFTAVSPIAQCMVNAGAGLTDAACGLVNMQYVAGGNYLHSNAQTTQIVASMFASQSESQEAVRTLFQTARHQGMTGNYAIGLGAVDYFFSSTATTYTFTWGHGNWVYTVSSASFAELETILNNLPF